MTEGMRNGGEKVRICESTLSLNFFYSLLKSPNPKGVFKSPFGFFSVLYYLRNVIFSFHYSPSYPKGLLVHPGMDGDYQEGPLSRMAPAKA